MRHLLAALVFTLIAACSSEPADESYVYGDPASAPASARSTEGAATDAPGDSRVAILDHGLRMSRGTQAIPAGWKLTQDIATDPNTGQLARYRTELRGPNGEVSIGMGHTSYAQLMGTNMEQAWRNLAMRGLELEVQNVEIGGLRRSASLENLVAFRRAVQMGRQSGMTVQGLEAPLRGTYEGQAVAGFIYVMHFGSPQMPGNGTVQVSAMMSPPDRLAETIRINQEMANSFEPNPEFEQRVRQIGQVTMQRQQAQSQQWMANSQRMHEQRMAANRAQFEGHQRMMQDRYATNDQMNQQWMDNFRNSGTPSTSGSAYTSHDAFIDGIYERNTFDDPYSGQQVHTEGYYDQWYTNGQGDYIGTNDPNFNTYPLPGDWQQTQPLEPTP